MPAAPTRLPLNHLSGAGQYSVISTIFIQPRLALAAPAFVLSAAPEATPAVRTAANAASSRMKLSLRWHICRCENRLVAKVATRGEHHGDPRLVAGVDDLVVALRAARLD